MNRRTFLTRLSAGIAGAALTAHVPLTWLPAPIQRHAALDWLRTAYNQDVERRMLDRHNYPHIPTDSYPSVIIVNPWLYDKAESEVGFLFRFTGSEKHRLSKPTLSFKGATLIADVDCPIKNVYLLGDDEGKRYLARFYCPA